MNKLIVNIISVIAVVGLLFTFGCKKKDKVDTKKAFVKYFGGFKGHTASEVLQTSDGGYIIAGTSTNEGIGDIIVIKTDEEGNEKWHKILGKSGDYYDECGSIAIMPDGGFMVVGTTSLIKNRIFNVSALEVGKDNVACYAARLSSAGEVIWSKKFPNPSDPNVQIGVFGKSLVVENNGDCLVAGMVDISLDVNSYAFLMDKNGTVITDYGNSMKDGSLGQIDYVTQVIAGIGSPLPNNYALTSSTIISGEHTPRIVPFRLNGPALQQFTAPTKSDWHEASYYDATRMASVGGTQYLLAGTKGTPPSSSDIYVIKLQDNLSVKIKSWTYGDLTPGTKDLGISVIPTTDGGFAVLGITNSASYTGDAAKLDDVVLVKADANGIEQWHKVFGGRGNDVATKLIQTTDGGYLICGTITFGDDVSNSGNSNAITLIKLDADGELNNIEK